MLADESRASIVDRMFGAARLDVHTYEGVEADTSATLQAVWVVILVSVASGIGLLGTGGGFGGLIVGLVLGVAQWAIWARYRRCSRSLRPMTSRADLTSRSRTFSGYLLVVPSSIPLDARPLTASIEMEREPVTRSVASPRDSAIHSRWAAPARELNSISANRLR